MADSVGAYQSTLALPRPRNVCVVHTNTQHIDRVFGHALNTVNKIRPGSQKPPSADRLALYGLYKQSMEGDVADLADRPTTSTEASSSDAPSVKKEQEKWDAWKANEGLSRTEAKRRYIEKLVETMHKYASNTPEARELVEELEFVWDQVKNNSQHPSSGSEHSSPLAQVERSGYLQNGSSGQRSSEVAAMENAGGGPIRSDLPMRVLSPVSQSNEEELMEEEREEFVDAPVSQGDEGDLGDISEHGENHSVVDAGVQAAADQPRPSQPSRSDLRWRKRVESSLIKMTNEVAALREQLESSRYFRARSRRSFWGWIFRLSWWAIQLVVADAVLLWVAILYLRKKDDRRLEGAVRVLLGDAVAQVQKQIPNLPKIGGTKKPAGSGARE